MAKHEAAEGGPAESSAIPNPFVGPASIKKGQRIFGRDLEIEKLYYLLSAERIVLLYSPSGAGKTSLIQAGLIPRLARQFDVWGPARVNSQPPERSDTPPGEGAQPVNRYLRSAILGFEEDAPSQVKLPAPLDAAISFDLYVKQRIARSNAGRNPVLIFDQFEEMIAVEPNALEAKREFFEQLGEMLENNQNVWALFVLREDYLAPFDAYLECIPNRLRSRFRLGLLTQQAAAEVIESLVREGPPKRAIAPDALNKLVADLSLMQVQQPSGAFETLPGPYVEPMYLQIAGKSLWERMDPSRPTIEKTDLDSFGGVTQALARYYADAVARIASGSQADERRIRDWVGRLITRANTRGQVQLGEGTTGGLDNKTQVQPLVASHLVRGEERAGATWFELSHDRLIKAVQEDNRRWFDERLSPLQKTAALWAEQSKPEGLLFLGNDLNEAQADPRNAGLEGDEKEFLAASVARQNAIDREKRNARLVLVALYCAIGFAIAAVGFLYLAMQQGLEARRATAATYLASAQSTIAQGKSPGPALAAFAKALKYDPSSFQIRAWITSLLTRRSYWLPKYQFPNGETNDGSKAVTCADMSPDGSRVATNSGSAGIQIWDAATGKPLGPQLTFPTPHVGFVRFSPDGSKVIAGFQSTAQLWDARSFKAIGEPIPVPGEVASLEFSRDSRRFLTVSIFNLEIRVWDANTGKEVAGPLQSAPPANAQAVVPGINDARFSPDGSRIVAAYDDGAAKVWDLGKCQLEKPCQPSLSLVRFESDRSPFHTAAFSPDGAFVLTSSALGASIWCAIPCPAPLPYMPASQAFGRRKTEGELAFEFSLDNGDTLDAEFSPSGHEIVTASSNGSAGIWDWRGGKAPALVHTLRHESPVVRARYTDAETPSLDSTADAVYVRERIMTVSSDNSVNVWESSGERTGANIPHLSFPTATVISSDGNRVLTASEDAPAQVWELDSLTRALPFPGRVCPAHSDSPLAITPAGIRVAGRDGPGPSSRMVVLNAANQPQGPPIAAPDFATLSPDGARLLTARATMEYPAGGDPGGVFTLIAGQLWDVPTGKPIGSQLPMANFFEFSPDGQKLLLQVGLANNGTDGEARVFNANTGAGLGSFPHPGISTSHFSMDGKSVVSAYWHGTKENENGFDYGGAALWDAATGKVKQTLPGDGVVNILDAAIGPGGSLIAIGSETGAVDILPAGRLAYPGNPIRTGGRVQSVQFSPSGKYLMTLTYSAAQTSFIVQVWDVATRTQIGAAFQSSSHIGNTSFAPGETSVLIDVDALGVTEVLDLKSGDALGVSIPNGNNLKAIYSPDGERVLTGPNPAAGGFEVNSYPIALATDKAKGAALQAKLAELLGGYSLDEKTGKAVAISPMDRYRTIQMLRSRYGIPPDEDFLEGLQGVLDPEQRQ